MLKLITIDLYNTLIKTEKFSLNNSARLKVLKNTLQDVANFDINEASFARILEESWAFYTKIWVNDLRTPSTSEIINYIWAKFGLNVGNNAAICYVIKFFEESILLFPPDFLPNAIESVKNLSVNYKVGIISDTGFSPGVIIRELFARVGLTNYISAYSFSNETGVAKPHPRAFTTILEQLNIDAADSLHIGDIERTDIAGANAVGMKSIRFDGDFSKIEPVITESKANFVANDWLSVVNYISTL
jgi:putative hydrolase of the HAD superfamily